MAKSKYNEICDQITEKINATVKPNGKHPVASSTSDLTAMTQALMNSPEYVVTEYSTTATEEDGSPVTIEKKPGERYRESLKPMLKAMGLDKAEADKLDDYQFSKEQSNALMGVAMTSLKDYISIGRKYKFPVTSMDESQMSISCDTAPERSNATKRFEKGPDGKSVPVDTGKIVTTAAHKVIKTSNAVPHWLKTDNE